MDGTNAPLSPLGDEKGGEVFVFRREFASVFLESLETTVN